MTNVRDSRECSTSEVSALFTRRKLPQKVRIICTDLQIGMGIADCLKLGAMNVSWN
ncbi:hypothetical protein [Pelagibius marinus]|uniref:hypothetical protein n=1 Tax=Pelagibius marinus TaxID=2762760 RepID=UPI001872D993|nr:hypothetical protein [Pelagibius marinus]